MVAAEAGLRALVTAADDFAAPLVAAQRAALDDAVAAAGATPPSAFEGVRSEFEAKLRELEGAIAAGLAKERAAIDALGASARAAGEDTAEAVAARFDPARVALGERLQASRAAAEPKNTRSDASERSIAGWRERATARAKVSEVARKGAG